MSKIGYIRIEIGLIRIKIIREFSYLPFYQFQIPDLFIHSSRVESVTAEAKTLPKLSISTVELQWLQVLAEGWAYPLRGFMREHEYLQTLHFNCIRNEDEPSIRENQSVPIVLSCSEADRARFADVSAIALFYNDEPVAILRKPEIYYQRKEERCSRQFGTNNPDHPYIKMIHASGDYLIGGDVEVIERIRWNDGLDKYRLTPNELREKYRELNADAVFAFQLRNPIHNGHALLMRDCRRQLLERKFMNPVLLLHPLGGWTKDVRILIKMGVFYCSSFFSQPFSLFIYCCFCCRTTSHCQFAWHSIKPFSIRASSIASTPFWPYSHRQ